MPTERQKKLARAIVKNAVAKEPMTKAELVVSSGYSETTGDRHTATILNTQGVQEALKELGYLEKFRKEIPDEMLIRVTKEGLDANKVISANITYGDADSKTTDFIDVPDHQTRHKFLETAYKLRGDFAPEKHITINAELKASLPQEKIDEINRLALDD